MKKSVIVSNVALQDAKLHASTSGAGSSPGLGPRPARGGAWAARAERGAEVRIATDGECGTNVFLFVVVA